VGGVLCTTDCVPKGIRTLRIPGDPAEIARSFDDLRIAMKLIA
jgi:hypothetical protein